MEDKESGSLSQKSALDILLELHQGSVTGSLKLERPPLQKAVYFRDGQILFAASNDPKDQLASILVEEGKLGPEQMEVAQARATPGNPLAKVLTELGYISQRELAEAARIKVEKILTDLYTWNEGTYQFLTKSLPKGGLDLALSTSRLLFASIRRLQDREWVLSRLGSLEAVLRPSPTFDQFIAEVEPEDPAADTLRLADGVKTVKQIGALSSLGEFDVCKVLAAALVAGGLEDAAARAVVASADAFSLPGESPAFEPPSFESETPSFEPPAFEPPPPPPASTSSGSGTGSSGSSVFGNETIGLETPSSQSSSDTVFQAPPREPAEEPERTIFDEMPSPSATGAGGPAPSFGRPTSASQLLVDEPEPESDFPTRTPPKPKGMRRGGGGGSGGIGGALKWVAVFAIAAGAGYALYTFGWPMIASQLGGGSEHGGQQVELTTTAPPVPIPGGTTPAGSGGETPATSGTGTDPGATASGTVTVPPTTSGTPPTPTPATSSVAPSPQPAPATTSAPRPAATTSSPRPTPAPAPSGGGNGGALLKGGNVAGAAAAFQRELSSTPDRFTIAVGLYCNSDNVLRIASGVNNDALYVLPTSIDGKRCYRVIWGLFTSRDAASSAMRSLPSGISAGDAAVVDLSRLLR